MPTHVMTFMRANPPTAGHETVVNKVLDVAKKTGGSHSVILSHSQDPKKNPLTPDQKVGYARIAFPNTNVSVATPESPTLLHQASDLYNKGVTHLHVVAGSDRVAEYKKKFKELNGKPNKEGNIPFNFKKITVHSAGTRDPDAEGDAGMSGTKMRGHAAAKDFASFRKGVPSHVSDEHAHELMHDVRRGMGHTD